MDKKVEPLKQSKELVQAIKVAQSIIDKTENIERLLEHLKDDCNSDEDENSNKRMIRKDTSFAEQSEDIQIEPKMMDKETLPIIKRVNSVNLKHRSSTFFKFEEEPKDPLILQLEKNLIDLGDKLESFEFTFKEDAILFQSILDTTQELDNSKVYNSNIGKYLKNLLFIAESKCKESSDFERIYHILDSGINKLRKKLMNGFFNYKKLSTNTRSFLRRKLIEEQNRSKVQEKTKKEK